MIQVTEPKLKQAPEGDSLSFSIEFCDPDGALGMRVNGARITAAGQFYGPSWRSGRGAFKPQVEFFTLRPAVLEALYAAGWPKKFPGVKFPEREAPHA